jgi:iron-sulfur cluster repair protein YtfE (RIC family)
MVTRRRKSTPSARPARARRTAKRPDAIAMLKDDHKRVSAMFAQYQKMMDNASDAAKQKLVGQICSELTVHTTLEEEIFYPAARAALDAKGDDLLDEAAVEHASAKSLIAQLESATPTDALYDAKVTVLGEYIKHHVKEEHEDMFPKCRKAKMDLNGLGAQMAERKAQLA